MSEDSLVASTLAAMLSRRSLLRRAALGSATLAMSAGLLAACGGDDDDDDATAQPTSAGSAPTAAGSEPTAAGSEPTTASGGTGTGDATATTGGGGSTDTGAVETGGVFSSYEAANPPSLDPYVSGSQGASFWASYSFSRLFMSLAGPDVPKGSLEVEGDVAEGFEVSEDATLYTITIRDDVMWHPPLDRAMTVDDITFSWGRFSGETSEAPSPRHEDIEFVTAVEKVDESTVSFTLEAPYPFFLARLADPKVFFILPEGTDTDYNPAEEIRGSGPWILSEYSPDSKADYVRNPKWHKGPERPYFDGVTVNIVPEYATQLSQFLGGNLDWVVVQGGDLSRVLKDVEGVQIYERPPYPLSVLNFSPAESRWEDVRLRQAVSMALDRDAMLDAAYGLPEIEEAGFPVERQWHSFVPVAFSEYWVDPKADDAPAEMKKLFTYDPDAAAALVEEAGGGFSTELHYAAANSRYGEAYRIMSELIVQYLGQIGIQATALEEDYNTTFLGTNGTSSGNFNGLMWIPQTRTDPTGYFLTQYLNPNHGMYGRFKDPELAERMEAILAITDRDALRTAIREVQTLLSTKAYVLPMPYGSAPTYVAYQPWVKNAMEYQTFAQGGPTETLTHWWYDR